jgi:hypothetical protein
MKFWKQTLITLTAFLGITVTVTYTSCVQDSCTALQCQNGGSCADGYCRCPTGYEGAECENRIADRFVGTYTGSTRCDENPAILDTLDIYVVDEPLTLGMKRRSQPDYEIRGFAEGNRIIVADRKENNQAWFANAVFNEGRVTVYIEHVSDIAQNQKTVCNFVGSIPAKPKTAEN